VSDQIKHECGIGLIRLLKPLNHYRETYGTALWGLNRMSLLMEKQHNRGQDGAGIAAIKLDVREGLPFLARERSNTASPLTDLFTEINVALESLERRYPGIKDDPDQLVERFPFAAEVLLGHLRYGTHGDNSIEACHPVVRSNNYRARTLAIAGNFNLTNVDDLFNRLVELGQHPRHFSDTETVLERIGHFLDEEYHALLAKFSAEGDGKVRAHARIATDLDLVRVITRAAKRWDGGYAMSGLVGSGDAFVARDPNGIRPCYYYKTDEYVVAASERTAIATVFNVAFDDIIELLPGHVLVIKRDGTCVVAPFTKAGEKRSCSFERIYFSRGNDPAIYQERQALGGILVPKILEAVQNDLVNTVFSYIPNTAEMAFWGMVKGVETHMINEKIAQIRELNGKATDAQLVEVLSTRPRVEKAVLKDAKLRTFITQDNARDDLVAHVYDVTQGTIRPGIDSLVCIDDSIVRGTTLKRSILQILSRLRPKKIVIVSSAPQIRYPDCYGIDMSQIGRFVAFEAAIALLNERGMSGFIRQVYRECVAMKEAGKLDTRNAVKTIYEEFTEEEVSKKIAELLTPKDLGCEVVIVFQPLANLATAIPNHRGDWYFSGDYPTPGGVKVVNQAFMNWVEGSTERAY
jgi:amidophosphoribosyltransferase